MPNVKRKPHTLSEQVKQVAGSLVAWGRSPFGRRDEANGARVAGYRLVRGPDGQLYATKEDRDD
jgi:hypothetical protein